MVKSVTNWEFVLEENGMPKVLGSGTYGTVSKIINYVHYQSSELDLLLNCLPHGRYCIYCENKPVWLEKQVVFHQLQRINLAYF